MVRLLLIILSLSVISSCTGKAKEDLKSPCVGAENSPCGPRKPVNNWLS